MKDKILNLIGVVVGTLALFYTIGVLWGLEGDTFTFWQAVPRLIGGGVMTLACLAAANYNNDMEEEA